MLIFLLAFALIPLAVRSIGLRLGVQVFPLIALLPFAAFVHALTQTPEIAAGRVVTEHVSWIPQLGIDLSLRLDPLSWLMTLIVTGIGALVLFYCTFYFRASQEGLGRFAAVLLAFTGSMYGLVIADNIYLLFIFWEATSVFSYLLIGHYTGRRASRSAALQALIVTTAGGLVMLIGLVLLHAETGLTTLSALVALTQTGPGVTIAIVLILVGALSKSAIFPFHFWLPSAMAAPTPVSAYLHAAAMVQAGIYLVARLAPGYADTFLWREILLTLGLATMLLGAWKALTQTDLKLLLAYGTVSQLGFLIVVVGYGTHEAALAGVALVAAHALYKAALFLIVGIIDHRAGTRDLRKLSGLGREAPVLAATTVLAVASMAGLPLTFGFVAKESVLTSLLDSGADGSIAGWISLAVIALGSLLTVAYSARFLWGGFARKPGVEEVRPVHESAWFGVPPALLAITGVVLGVGAASASPLFELYAHSFDTAGQGAHLAAFHGFDTAFAISAMTILGGVALFFAMRPVASLETVRPLGNIGSDLYWRFMRGVDRLAARLTATTQRGSLPFYLGVILLGFIVSVGVATALNQTWPTEFRMWDGPAQLGIGAIMAVAALAVTRAGKRFQAALLVGATGYGIAAIFAFHGAPDLALTQVLVETVTLVAFVLVLRRLPPNLGEQHESRHRLVRALVGAGVGVTIALVALIALAARTAAPISLELPQLAFEGGHGINVVNVVLVDIRGWDTLGELSVIIAAATGVASLVFLRSRTDNLPRPPREVRRTTLRARLRPLPEQGRQNSPAYANEESTRSAWLLAGFRLAPENRSILLEVVTRLLFHAVIVLSVFVLFSGHNATGGGFAGGLVAGLALAARYLAGGRYELGAAAPLDAGKLLGAGLIFAAGTATMPLFFGLGPLQSVVFDFELPLLGELEIVSSTFFDIGVYLVVVGMVLDVLRSLGAEVDRQQEDESDEIEEGSLV